MLAVLLVCGLALNACKSGKSEDKGDGGGNGCGSANCGTACGGGTDMADSVIKMYKDGTMKASPFVVLHSYVSVGQTWGVTSSFGGQKSETRWQVSAKAAGTKSEFIIEHDMGQGYILAYQVDSWAEAGKQNVKKAWIGKPGEKPEEIQVMEWTAPTNGGKAEINGIVLREDFSNLELAGETFKGELTIVKADGNTSKTWIASNGWFGGLVKMESNGDVVMELTTYKFHEKPDTWLKWEEDEKK
jgi:hypothetical protein